MHYKKKVKRFPVSSMDVTNQTIPGRENFKLCLALESFVNDIPAGDGKIANLFLQCGNMCFSIDKIGCYRVLRIRIQAYKWFGTPYADLDQKF